MATESTKKDNKPTKPKDWQPIGVDMLGDES